jgi:addiction module RelB/DinJ family antitoxin
LTHKENCNTIVLQGDDFMAMDATLQIRIDSAVKEQVEALYRNLGTSFAEAVRMFAQQSLQEGGMPFRPSLRAWDDMSEAEISEKLSRSSKDIAAGRISEQCDMDAKVKELLQSRAAKI